MPIENTKTPDPLVAEFCELTGMSPDKIHHSKPSVPLSKMKEGKARRHRHGIKLKVSSPGSTSVGAGSILRNLRSLRTTGKSRKRNESSPIDTRGGKRVIKSPNIDVEGSNLKFEMGSTFEHRSDSKLVGYSSKACGSVCDNGIAGSNVRNEHISMDGVVNADCAPSNNLNGIACNKDDMDFEFGKSDRGKGILKKPSVPLLKVQFENNVIGNPFIKNVAPTSNMGNWRAGLGCNVAGNPFLFNPTSSSKIGNWSAGFGNDFGSTIISNQYSAVADRFAEKLKKRSEELALKMENTPGFVSVQENGKIMSGVGRHMLMDKMTKERCLKKAGKLDFARVLVEVSAEEDLPSVLEISYPPLGNRPARVGKLEVKYQWKLPLCTHCKTFGHSTVVCKSRPRTQEEIAAKAIKDAINVKENEVAKNKPVVVDDDGFTTVGKNNRPMESSQNGVPSKTSNNNKQSNGQPLYSKSIGLQNKVNGKQDFFQMKNKGNAMVKTLNEDHSTKHKSTVKNSPSKSLQQLSKDPNFKPKVLVRGSCSNNTSGGAIAENIPLSNTFAAFNDEEMLDDALGGSEKKQNICDNKEWQDLRSEVDVLLSAGIYPSKTVRLDWTLHQLDYFYKNCHKYKLDPIPDSDEDDVVSECDGIASEMKPEYDVYAASSIGNDAAPLSSVSNGI
ncbi:hypothetical protein CTI12_AA210590 [Artemisia annua]|uniref:DUF4283 domain-containing protein n=1 Tax=Artemisia annua TaxID=35608 RepID=A0A2U1NZL9_ARTAN|nr:hypothetical protein CTI12_AA210590 [Artemisia annua]